MDTIWIADMSVEELCSLFRCDVDDDDYYDVVAFNLYRMDNDALLQMWDASEGRRKDAILFAIGQQPLNNYAASLLAKELSNQESSHLATVISSLRHLRLVQYVEQVEKYLEHENSLVVVSAIQYLVATLGIDSAKVLLPLVNHSAAIVRETLIDELANVSGFDLSQLEVLLEDSNEQVREAFQQAKE